MTETADRAIAQKNLKPETWELHRLIEAILYNNAETRPNSLRQTWDSDYFHYLWNGQIQSENRKPFRSKLIREKAVELFAKGHRADLSGDHPKLPTDLLPFPFIPER